MDSYVVVLLLVDGGREMPVHDKCFDKEILVNGHEDVPASAKNIRAETVVILLQLRTLQDTHNYAKHDEHCSGNRESPCIRL